jgi:hypothetical protein
MDLFGGELMAIDGSKFKALNNHGRNFKDRKLHRATGGIDKKIDYCVREMDEDDARVPEERKPSAVELKEKIERQKGRYTFYCLSHPHADIINRRFTFAF